MIGIDTGLSALRASQDALEVIANNIANANTPGFHRQRVDLVDRRPVLDGNLLIGRGVDVARITRLKSDFVEASLLNANSDQARVDTRLTTLEQIESLFTPGEGSLHDRIGDFFTQWDALTTQPGGSVERREVLQAAAGIADELNRLADALADLKTVLASDVESTVKDINRLSTDIADKNQQIALALKLGQQPNDLLDQRDQLVSELSQLIGVSVVRTGEPTPLLLADGAAYVSSQHVEFSAEVIDGDQIEIHVPISSNPIDIHSGRLAALLESHNQIIPEIEQRLDVLASELVQSVNALHATGVGLDGSFQVLHSTRPVIPTDVPLAEPTTDFPVQSGSLFVTVTDTATGERTLHEIDIDPAVDSLEAVAGRLDSIPNLQAIVDPQSGQLSLVSDSGFAFDFTGQLPSATDVVTGSITPLVTGRYSGESDQRLTFVASGMGTIGLTPGLTLEVRDESGQLLRTLDVGAGYAPGDPLDIGEGVSVQFPGGDLVAGDTFGLTLVAEPDTSGFLAMVGARDLFTGRRPGTLGVNSHLLAHPDQLAAGGTGASGDNRVAERLAALRDEPLLVEGTVTFAEYLAEATADAGTQVRETRQQAEQLAELTGRLVADREAVSGVDTNEELVRMLQFQRMFQSAAQFLTSANQAFDEILEMVR